MQGGWPLITDFGVSVELQNAPELRVRLSVLSKRRRISHSLSDRRRRLFSATRAAALQALATDVWKGRCGQGRCLRTGSSCLRDVRARSCSLDTGLIPRLSSLCRFLGVAHPAIYWAPSPEEWDAVVSVIDNDHGRSFDAPLSLVADRRPVRFSFGGEAVAGVLPHPMLGRRVLEGSLVCGSGPAMGDDRRGSRDGGSGGAEEAAGRS